MTTQILPNLNGYGVLAQEVYEKMAFAPAIKKKIQHDHFNFMNMYQWQAYTSEEN